jgi:hypothetical protein
MVLGMRVFTLLQGLLLFTGVFMSPAVAAQCEAVGKNRFSGVIVIPGSTASLLAARLARTADYDGHGSGWLSQRLFSLADDIEINGELVKGGQCFKQEADDDLTFFVLLSPQSRKNLSAYFSPPEATPLYIHVEMVALPVANRPPAFKTWRSKLGDDRVQFATDGQSFQPIRAAGGELEAVDWVTMRKSERKYISVRGGLVVDTSGSSPGNGELEIHPVEYIRLSAQPF